MVNLHTNLKSLSLPVMKKENAMQKVENLVVWGSYWSLRVTGNSAIRYRVYEFLLAFYRNKCPNFALFVRYREILANVTNFNLPNLYLRWSRWGWPHLNFTSIYGFRKLESLGLVCALLCLLFSHSWQNSILWWTYTGTHDIHATIAWCSKRFCRGSRNSVIC